MCLFYQTSWWIEKKLILLHVVQKIVINYLLMSMPEIRNTTINDPFPQIFRNKLSILKMWYKGWAEATWGIKLDLDDRVGLNLTAEGISWRRWLSRSRGSYCCVWGGGVRGTREFGEKLTAAEAEILILLSVLTSLFAGPYFWMIRTKTFWY